LPVVTDLTEARAVVHGWRRSPLSDTLVAELAADILAGHLATGAIVPPEPQLCIRFGVSRTVVREAMARLQRMGLVRIRQGLGTIVLPRADWREFDPELVQIRAVTGQIEDLLPELLVVRRMVEVEVAGDVARHRSEDDLGHLAGLIAAMDTTGNDPAAQTELDLAFHESLIVASGNRLLREMMQPISQLRRIGSLITTSSDDRIIAASNAGHTAIFRAIATRDDLAARAAMAKHLAQFERDLLAAKTTPAESRHGGFTHAAGGMGRPAGPHRAGSRPPTASQPDGGTIVSDSFPPRRPKTLADTPDRPPLVKG
jgi:DNA-binding FadR family transcriptional regulator